MDGIDKLTAVVGGRTLLASACDAASGARRLVVVGPPTAVVPAGTLRVQEDPPFAGPAAAMGAGLAALGDDVSDHVLVVAADVPRAAEVVQTLLRALASHPERDGAAALGADGRRQPLLAVHRVVPFRDALLRHAPLADLSAMRVTADLDLLDVVVDDDVLADVDTRDDLDRLTREHRDG